MKPRTGLAAAYDGRPREIGVRRYRLPPTAPGSVMLRTIVANICGSDLHLWRGETDLQALGRSLPQPIGHEMVGRIIALGEGVAHDAGGVDIAIGDRIVFRPTVPCGRCRPCARGLTRACRDARAFLRRSMDEPPHFLGALAEYQYLLPGVTFYRVPESIEDALAATANCALAEVFAAVELAAVTLEDEVVVQGCGGLGLAAVAVLRSLGVARIVAVDVSPERLLIASEMGATTTVRLDHGDGIDAQIRAVVAETSGHGADLVLGLAGTPSAFAAGVGMLGVAGRLVEVGNVTPGRLATIDPSLLVFRNKTIHGLVYYEPRHLEHAVQWLGDAQNASAIPKMLGSPFAFRDLDAAFQAADSHAVGRASIRFD